MLSTRQTFSEEPRCAEGRCSVCPLSLSASIGSGPFNLVSDSHCRDRDSVGGSLHDARDWIHTANGQWVDVSTLMSSSPLARLAYSPKPAAAEQSSTEKGCTVGRRICSHELPPRYHHCTCGELIRVGQRNLCGHQLPLTSLLPCVYGRCLYEPNSSRQSH